MNNKKNFSIAVIFLFVFTSLSLPQVKGTLLRGKADLVPKISGPTSAFPGSSLGNKIKVGIKNAGVLAAKNFGVDLVLSKNTVIPVKFASYSATFKEDCLLKGGREFVQLLKGRSRMKLKLNGTNKIPADTPPGWYYLAVVVDSGKTVSESNEWNNVAMYRIRILKRPVLKRPKIKRPDLIVRNIQIVRKCKIKVTLKNIGTAGVPASYYTNPDAAGVQMYMDGKPWGGIILKGFDPAGKLKVPGGIASHIWFPKAANLNLPPGVHKIKVVADHNNNLPELRENNNILTKKLGCKQFPAKNLPDLVINKTYFEIQYAGQGDSMGWFYFEIKNLSHPLIKTSSAKCFVLRYWFDAADPSYYEDENVCGAHLTTLRNTGKVTIESYCPDVIANYNFKSKVDATNQITEKNEFNNTFLGMPYSTIPKVDLIISKVYVELDYPGTGDVSGNFCFDLENLSHPAIKTSASQCFDLGYWIDSTDYATYSTSNVCGAYLTTLRNTGKVTFKIHSPDVVARNNLKGFVDATFRVSENNENNNKKTEY